MSTLVAFTLGMAGSSGTEYAKWLMQRSDKIAERSDLVTKQSVDSCAEVLAVIDRLIDAAHETEHLIGLSTSHPKLSFTYARYADCWNDYYGNGVLARFELECPKVIRSDLQVLRVVINQYAGAIDELYYSRDEPLGDAFKECTKSASDLFLKFKKSRETFLVSCRGEIQADRPGGVKSNPLLRVIARLSTVKRQTVSESG